MALTRIDRHIIRANEHYFLREDDDCYYLREYTSHRGYKYSATNQLITNFKIPVSERNTRRWHYKEQAIEQIAHELAQCLDSAALPQFLMVPIPPSKAESDPLYDDRMERVLRKVPGAQVASVLRQRGSIEATHKRSHQRPTLEQLIANYECVAPKSPPHAVLLVDDVLTSGAHFRAAATVLAQRFPGVPLSGIFIARRITPSPSPPPPG